MGEDFYKRCIVINYEQLISIKFKLLNIRIIEFKEYSETENYVILITEYCKALKLKIHLYMYRWTSKIYFFNITSR